MYTEMALIARRFALTLAVTGIATMGSVALATTASAAPVAQDGPSSVVEKSGSNGPDEFLILEHGKKPIFFCEDDQPNKQHNNCIDLTGPTRF